MVVVYAVLPNATATTLYALAMTISISSFFKLFDFKNANLINNSKLTGGGI